jgi:hypothetical protein
MIAGGRAWSSSRLAIVQPGLITVRAPIRTTGTKPGILCMPAGP